MYYHGNVFTIIAKMHKIMIKLHVNMLSKHHVTEYFTLLLL